MDQRQQRPINSGRYRQNTDGFAAPPRRRQAFRRRPLSSDSQERLRRQQSSQAQSSQPNKNTKKRRKTPSFKKLALLKKPRFLIGASLLLLLMTVAGGYYYYTGNDASGDPQDIVAGSLTKKTPKFTPLMPSKSNENPSVESAYDAQRDVLSYRDNVDGIEVIVSQQPLPPRFEGDPQDELEELAAEMNALDVVPGTNPVAYSGVSEKGPQTVVLVRDELLIFIFASRSVDNTKLSEYIGTLQ